MREHLRTIPIAGIVVTALSVFQLLRGAEYTVAWAILAAVGAVTVIVGLLQHRRIRRDA